MKLFMPGLPLAPRQVEETSGATVEMLSRRVAELEARIGQLECGTAETRRLPELEDRSSR
jgi:hypothetical protein